MTEMKKNNFRNMAPKSKCNACGSDDVKVRKNFSHGSGSSSKKSYIFRACGSSDVAKPQVGRFRR